MNKMTDGIDFNTTDKFLSSLSEIDKLNQIVLDQNLIGYRFDLFSLLSNKHLEEVELQLNLLSKYRLEPAGWTINHRLLFQDKFYAEAGGHKEVKERYEIWSSIANPAILMSVAIDISSNLENSEISHLANQYKNNETSIDSWFPNVVNKKDISDEIINWVLDACLLLYFHEVAHVIFGHCRYNTKNDDEVRALEVDADYNAGTMFAVWLKNLSDTGREAFIDIDIVRRLTKAAFLLGVVFKCSSKESKKYHYPTTRVVIFISAGIQAIERLSGNHNSLDQEKRYIYLTKYTEEEQEPLRNALKKSSLKYYAGIESELEEDMRVFGKITFPLREKLKNGPLSSLKMPV